MIDQHSSTLNPGTRLQVDVPSGCFEIQCYNGSSGIEDVAEDLPNMKSGFVNRRLFGLFSACSVCFLLSNAQENRQSLVRLFRLDGTFSMELPAKIGSGDRPESPGFTLRDARLEDDGMGPLSRLRTVLTIANSAAGRRIVEVGWRLDIYDEALHSLGTRVLQTEKVNIYAGETGTASSRIGAVLPDRMVILFQLVKVSFADGSTWSAPVQCSLEEDLRTVSCKSN